MPPTEEQKAKLRAKAAAKNAHQNETANTVQNYETPAPSFEDEVHDEPHEMTNHEREFHGLDIGFSTSLLAFWIRGAIFVPDDLRVVHLDLPNTILGLILVGRDEQLIQLSNISGTMLKTQFKVIPMTLGAFIMMLSVGALRIESNSIFTLALLFFAGLLIFGSGSVILHLR